MHLYSSKLLSGQKDVKLRCLFERRTSKTEIDIVEKITN